MSSPVIIPKGNDNDGNNNAIQVSPRVPISQDLGRTPNPNSQPGEALGSPRLPHMTANAHRILRPDPTPKYKWATSGERRCSTKHVASSTGLCASSPLSASRLLSLSLSPCLSLRSSCFVPHLMLSNTAPFLEDLVPAGTHLVPTAATKRIKIATRKIKIREKCKIHYSNDKCHPLSSYYEGFQVFIQPSDLKLPTTPWRRYCYYYHSH